MLAAPRAHDAHGGVTTACACGLPWS